MKNEAGRKRSQDKPQRSQWPNQAHIVALEENDEEGKEDCLQQYPEKNLPVCDSFSNQSGDFLDGDLLRLANLLQASAQEHDAHRLQHQRDKQDDENFSHLQILVTDEPDALPLKKIFDSRADEGVELVLKLVL